MCSDNGRLLGQSYNCVSNSLVYLTTLQALIYKSKGGFDQVNDKGKWRDHKKTMWLQRFTKGEANQPCKGLYSWLTEMSMQREISKTKILTGNDGCQLDTKYTWQQEWLGQVQQVLLESTNDTIVGDCNGDVVWHVLDKTSQFLQDWREFE